MPAPTPSPALIEAELQRLARSAAFRRSRRHVAFLRHLVRATLDGDPARLREMVIGVEVFLRSATGFDPRRDTIVRVEARRLRQKLRRYYAEEGHDARLEFELPVGSYALRWRLRDTPESPPRRRIALAVHELVSHGSAAQPLGTLLSNELAAAVARLNGLLVVAAGAPLADETHAMSRALDVLHTDCALFGDLEVSGAHLRIRLRLLRCADGSPLWARASEVEVAHALRALEPLARGVVGALHRDAAERQLQRIRLSGSVPYVHALAGGDPTPEGLELLALARVALRSQTLDGIRKATRLAEQACHDMPGYAGAFSLLAEALITNIGWTLVPTMPALAAAERAAERALELDPEAADAICVRAEITFRYRRDWPAAESLLLRAQQLAPALAVAHARYGFALMMHRRFAEARTAYAEALALDPLSLLYRCHRALIDFYAEDWPRAAAGLDDVLAVAPEHVLAASLRAAVDLCAGDAAAACSAYDALHARWPRLSIGRCGRAQARALLGAADAARDDLRQLQAAFDAGDASPYQIAMVLTRLGDPAAAVQWLQRAASVGDTNYICVAADPSLAALRQRPDYRSLLATTGFAHLVDMS